MEPPKKKQKQNIKFKLENYQDLFNENSAQYTSFNKKFPNINLLPPNVINDIKESSN